MCLSCFRIFSYLPLVTCWELADLLALVCDVRFCFCHFPMWYPGSSVVLDCIVSCLCHLYYFEFSFKKDNNNNEKYPVCKELTYLLENTLTAFYIREGTLVYINTTYFSTVEVNFMMNSVFDNNFLATNANLICLRKIDKD